MNQPDDINLNPNFEPDCINKPKRRNHQIEQPLLLLNERKK